MKQIIAWLSFIALLQNSLSYFIVEVPENARQNFSLNLFRREGQANGLTSDYVVSPAAVQKFLVVLFDGARDNLRYEMLPDFCVKAAENIKFKDLAYAFRSKVFRAEANRMYFYNDFHDIKNCLELKNYIVGTNDFDNSFKMVSKQYFDVQTVNRVTEADQYKLVKSEFENIVDDNSNLQVLTSVAFEASLKHNFNLENGILNGVGKFRCGSQKNLRIIELPLQTNEELILQIFLPSDQQSLIDFIDNLGEKMTDMNEYDDKLEPKTVKVLLPELNFQNLTDLGTYFKSFGVGVKRMLTENIGMEYAFDNSTEGVKIDNFWLKTKVHIIPPVAGDISANEGIVGQNEINELENASKTFDATEKSFIYFIKSKNILYFSGVRVVP